MSDRFQGEGLELIQLPKKFPEHWQEETMRLRDLADVLHCSLRFKSEGNRRGAPRGDDTLALHLKDSLENLWTEIEEVTLDGFWQPRRWETKPWEDKKMSSVFNHNVATRLERLKHQVLQLVNYQSVAAVEAA